MLLRPLTNAGRRHRESLSESKRPRHCSSRFPHTKRRSSAFGLLTPSLSGVHVRKRVFALRGNESVRPTAPRSPRRRPQRLHTAPLSLTHMARWHADCVAASQRMNVIPVWLDEPGRCVSDKCWTPPHSKAPCGTHFLISEPRSGICHGAKLCRFVSTGDRPTRRDDGWARRSL